MGSFDGIVVGAGIVGAACACELARAGLNVVVCEETGVIGGGATAAGMGHLAVMDASEAQFALTSYSQALWRDLALQLPKDAEYRPCGSIWVASDDEEMSEVHRKFRFYSERGIPVEILNEAQLAAMEPNLRAGLAGGLLMPADAACNPPFVARYLLDGLAFLPDRRVTRVSNAGVEFHDGMSLAADFIILATGTAITRLIPAAPVYPRKGHLLMTDRYPGFVNHQLIELGYLKSAHATDSDSVAFNVQPRPTGEILVGSSRQYGATDSGVEPDMLRRMLARAVSFMPGLAGLPTIRAWTGFRAATPDSLPLIGLCPGYDRVYLATGHEGLGTSTSLGTAHLLADEILGRDPAIPREPYLPKRFVAQAVLPDTTTKAI